MQFSNEQEQLSRNRLDNKKWSGKRDSNPRPLPWQGNALPLSYSRARSTNVSIALTSTKFTGIQSLCQMKMCVFLIIFQQV